MDQNDKSPTTAVNDKKPKAEENGNIPVPPTEQKRTVGLPPAGASPMMLSEDDTGPDNFSPDTVSDLKQMVAPGDVQVVQTAESRWEGVLSICAFIFMSFVSGLLGTAYIYEASTREGVLTGRGGLQVPQPGRLWCFFQRGAPYLVADYSLGAMPVELCSVVVYYSLAVRRNLRPFPVSPVELEVSIPFLRKLRQRNRKLQIYMAVGGRRLSGVDVGSTSVLQDILARTELQETFLLHTLAVLEQHDMNGLVLDLARAVKPKTPELLEDGISKVTNFLKAGLVFMTDRARGFTFVVPEIPEFFAYYRLSELLVLDNIYAIQVAHDLYHADRKSCPAPYISDRLSPQKIDDIDGMITDASLRVANPAHVSKLIVTLSFEGSLYLTPGVTNRTETHSPARFYRASSYRKLCERIQNAQWTTRQDPANGTDCLCAWKDTKWASVWSLDSGSWIATRKADIGGVAVFGLHGDDFGGKCGEQHPLMKRINRLLFNTSDSG